MSNNQNQGASIEAALLPCAMCGGTAHLTKGYATENVWSYGEFHRVFCGACQIRQLFHRTAAEAIAAWNRRTPAATTGDGELPPLPEPIMGLWSEGIRKAWAEKMRAYGQECARAAIEADRAQQADQIQEAVGKFAIEVEKMLCAALGREWSVTGISIESLIADLRVQQAGAGREYQRKVDEKIIARRDAEIAELRAQLAAKGQVEMSGDVLYAAWHKVGADVAGLRFSDFMRALAAPASAQPVDPRVEAFYKLRDIAERDGDPEAASIISAAIAKLGAQPDQRESAAAAVASSRTIINPDGSSSTFISEYKAELENDLAAIRDLFPTPDFGELHNLWSEACSEPRAVVAYVKAQFEARAAVSPAAQPAKDEQNNGWQKLDDDFRLQFGRLVDVVLTNGVYEYGRRCNQVDWTQVQDWRYADSANNGADEQKGNANA